jgi:uncharacterized membrane protein YhaH (DUF805 family)
MDWVDLFTGFHGRISRQPFWIGVAVLAVVETVGQTVAHRIEGDRLGSIVDLAFNYCEFALTLKRAHDRNLPTWLVAALFAASVILDFLTVVGVDTDLGDLNNPNLIAILLTIPMTAAAIVLLIDLGFRPGTKGPNRFGPDPLAAQP